MGQARGRDIMETSFLNVEELLRKYANLLALYSEFETVSAVIFQELESGSAVRIIQGNLEVKMQVAEKIVLESRLIAGMKRTLFEETDLLGENDRGRVRQCEERLTCTVNRIVEQENRGRDLILRQGMKIERR